MLRIWLAVAVVGLTQPALADDLGPPLKPANKGRVQCYSPDPVKKTCKSISGYRMTEKGAIESIATVLVTGSPLVTMETITTIEIVEGRLCSQAKGQDIQGSNFTVDGRAAEFSQSRQLVKDALTASRSLLGRIVCTAFVTDADTVKAKVSVDGALRPDLEQPVIWVSQDDGYKVGP